MNKTIFRLAVLSALSFATYSCSNDDPTDGETPLPKVEVLEGTADGDVVHTTESTGEHKITFDDDMMSADVKFESKSDWHVEILTTKADDDEWIKISPMSGKAGAVNLKLELDDNDSDDDRTVSFSVVMDGVTLSFKIDQEADDNDDNDDNDNDDNDNDDNDNDDNDDDNDDSDDDNDDNDTNIELSSDDKDVSVAAGTFKVNVTSNAAWTATGMPGWVTLTPTKGNGNAEVTVTYTANATGEDRKAEIKFTASAGDDTDTETLTIDQDEK